MGQKAKEHKLLAGMRANPRGDWNIGHIETVCASVPDVIFRPPTRGGHFKVTHPKMAQILTIPAKKPLKPFYVKQFVSMMDSIMEGEEPGPEGKPEE
jgi:hypothetical protein